MARSFVVYGPMLVKVKGRFGSALANLQELGLTDQEIRVTPRGTYRDIKVDDYGDQIPAEVMWNLADCRIRIRLVHYDAVILNACIAEAFGGNTAGVNNLGLDGVLNAGGTLMGNGYPLFNAKNKFISLNLIPTNNSSQKPYRFPTTYLDSQPLDIPLGSERTIVDLSFRAIPYGSLANVEVTSLNKVLWDHTADS